MAVTTAPEATADTTRGGPPPTRMQLARGAGVVTAGPLLLALGSLVAPVAAVRRWPDRVHRDRARRAAWALTGADFLMSRDMLRGVKQRAEMLVAEGAVTMAR